MTSNFQTSTCLKLRSAGDNILENHPFNDFMIISTDLCTQYSIFWCCSINNSRPVSLLWFISNSKVSNSWSNRWGTGRKQCIHNLWLSNDAASFEAAQNNNYYSPDTEMFLPSPGTFRDQILERQVQKTIIISVQWHQPLASGVSCRYTLGITVLPKRSPFPDWNHSRILNTEILKVKNRDIKSSPDANLRSTSADYLGYCTRLGVGFITTKAAWWAPIAFLCL